MNFKLWLIIKFTLLSLVVSAQVSDSLSLKLLEQSHQMTLQSLQDCQAILREQKARLFILRDQMQSQEARNETLAEKNQMLISEIVIFKKENKTFNRQRWLLLGIGSTLAAILGVEITGYGFRK